MFLNFRRNPIGLVIGVRGPGMPTGTVDTPFYPPLSKFANLLLAKAQDMQSLLVHTVKLFLKQKHEDHSDEGAECEVGHRGVREQSVQQDNVSDCEDKGQIKQ